MLTVAPAAPPDEIKKAFRREIARYHPDKVQHLGPEFQEMAAGIAADLTEAYRILMDPATRATYDEELRGAGGGRPMPGPRPPVPDQPPPSTPPPPAPPVRGFEDVGPPPIAPRPTAGFEFVKRASMAKIREAIEDTLGSPEPVTAPAFDIAIVVRGKRGLFRKAEDSVCLVIKFVPFVDPEAVAAAWLAGAKVRAPSGVDGCVVLLIGQGIAPAKELSAAVSEQRRKLRNAGPVLVPVDVRDWEALFPPETPGPVRSLIQRLKDEKR